MSKAVLGLTMENRATRMRVRAGLLFLGSAVVLGLPWTFDGRGVAAPHQQAPPQFRAGTEVTRLELTVLDRRTRKPVTGLKADDFVVRVNGKRQPIVAATEVVRARGLSPPVAVAERAHDVTTNFVRPERLFVIVMNDAAGSNDPFERGMGQQVANRIVDVMDSVTDMGAVVFTRDNRHAQDFTRDRTLLRQAISRFNPIPTSETRVLERTMQFMQGVPGYRRAIFFVSADSVAARVRGLQSVLDRSLDSQWAGDQRSDVSVGAISAQQISHVPVYLFNTAGLRAPTAADLVDGRLRSVGAVMVDEAFQRIARATGGRAVINNNLPVGEVPAIFEEMESYYVVGYRHDYPIDGALRWLQVEVLRDGVLVMPSGTAFETPDDRELAGASAAPSARRDSGLLDVLGAPVAVGALPLSLGALPLVGAADGPVVVVTLGLPTVAAGQRETYQTSTLIFDGEGRKQLMRLDREVGLHGPSVPQPVSAEIVYPLSLPPGRYNVRVGVERTSDQSSGTVHTTVLVPDFARDPLSLSGVAIGRAESGSIGGREVLADLLPFAPTTVRTFDVTDRVGGLVRVHQGSRGNVAPVTLETEIVDEAGAVVHAATRIVEGLRKDGPGVEHRFELPLTTLGPGDYVLRFVATSGNARVQRDVRFSVN